MSEESRFQHRLGVPRVREAPTTSYRHRVNYHPLKTWWGTKRVDRRRLIASGGMASLGLVMLSIVGCGDDDDEAPAAEATPEDLIVAQAAMPVTFEHNFSVEHETQEAQQTQGSNLVNQVYIPDPFGSGYDRQDISGAAETFEGELAESWSLSDDGLTVTFKPARRSFQPGRQPLHV